MLNSLKKASFEQLFEIIGIDNNSSGLPHDKNEKEELKNISRIWLEQAHQVIKNMYVKLQLLQQK